MTATGSNGPGSTGEGSTGAGSAPAGLDEFGGLTRERLSDRLRDLTAEIGADAVLELELIARGSSHESHDAGSAPQAASGRAGDELRDALSTRLMEHYRLSQGKPGQGRLCFGLLYEMNAAHLLVQVASRLRRYQSRSDPRDVLQEVFFNVYRYPHRFDAARDDAFRVWSATIVRNTVLKHLRSLGRTNRVEMPVEDLSEHPEARSAEPQAGVIERESRSECARVYLTYLHLYLRFYSMLSERERVAIHLVEVEQVSYRDAAGQLGIKLENLKMVIFRARRKIHRSMRRVFDGLSPDCRPARSSVGAGGELADRLLDELSSDSDGFDSEGEPDSKARLNSQSHSQAHSKAQLDARFGSSSNVDDDKVEDDAAALALLRGVDSSRAAQASRGSSAKKKGSSAHGASGAFEDGAS